MSFFLSLTRILKFAWQNFWRNGWLSFITITILVLALLNVNALIVLNVIGQRAVEAVESKLDLSVSFKPDTSEELIAEAQGYLTGLSQVRTITALTPDEVLAAFKDEHEDDPDVLASLEEIDGNPFGAQLVITAHDPNDFAFIVEALQHPQYAPSIEETDYTDYQVMIDRINETTRQIQKGGIVVGGIFTLIALLIVFNSIRVAIYTHREEIGIMRLVGASGFFVRAPFLTEALFYTLLAVAIAFAIVYPLLQVVEPSLDAFLGTTKTGLVSFYNQHLLTLLAAQFIGFAILTVLSTSLAMRRYLRI